ncbi:hypothetical protein ACRARG_10315 [Pseudooceanicola sp. C21-150M6]|uniref:hypothetical protein n=1 Tax=Pseudooceanicola sp. C21-150M6 TaxID=3434355 RepID=UPI003D80003B
MNLRLLTCLPFSAGWIGLILAGPVLAETTGNDPSPFRRGDQMGTPASCDSLDYWVHQSPISNDRVTMTVEGRVMTTGTEGNRRLYTICPAAEVQVTCVITGPVPTATGIAVVAGGFSRVHARHIRLDPCQIYPVPDRAPPG